ncbi:hypothetical protein [Bacteriovorax sp. DB6_IX]|uniref:hypothetical protein n=1 Tax=Bacteriovorax sp. DB6_IX TaxID=1353530 RepID=UPI00038A4923|nr:hypothetical protein [Bacteriovorax sp. DB6_IX]EQC50564.1 hypothetical protein M901_2316 [Bacteriovorax sp. DB6_IX]
MVLLRKIITCISLFTLTLSCGKSADEVAESRMVSVEKLLTDGNCSEALSKINSFPARPEDARYVKLKASAYACKADYTTASLITDLKDLFSAGVSANFISSLTTMSLAQTNDGPINSSYTNLYTAIEALLFSGDTATTENPTASNRIADFNTTEADEINSYLFYLLLTEMGKYFYYYGDTDNTGAKGGKGNHLCLMSYDNVGNIAAILGAGATGSCTATGQSGSPDLRASAAASINVNRACQGIVLFNNFYDTFPNIALGSLSGVDLSSLQTVLDTGFTTLLSVGGLTDSSIVDMRSVELCESQFATNTDDIQIYFANVFETLHSL